MEWLRYCEDDKEDGIAEKKCSRDRARVPVYVCARVDVFSLILFMIIIMIVINNF